MKCIGKYISLILCWRNRGQSSALHGKEYNFLISLMWKENLASIFLSHPVFIIDKLLVVLVHCAGLYLGLRLE